MSIYVYCPRRSTGALELVRALGATRLRTFDGLDFWDKSKRRTLKEGDVVVCWGASIPDLEGIKVLNCLPAPINKLEELNKLATEGVPCVRAYSEVAKVEKDLLIPRVVNHAGGRDLLVSPDIPDYYVFRENFAREFRVHSFGGRSIRAGVKVPREGFTPAEEVDWKPDAQLIHPWVRSFDGGWRLNYDGFVSTQRQRKYAHSAVKALGLTFGAVDIGERADGSMLVLEVNTAPGIEGGSVGAYTRAITRWIEAPEKAAEQP